jgi:hypothetical protein
MTENPQKKLKPIEQCPDGHFYNTSRTGDICAVCGKKLDPPEPEETENHEDHALLGEELWACGWLVCTKGVNKGRAYTIKNGKNFIGSTSSMDIQIVGDKKIEKKNHAVIMYDSRQKKTLLLPTDSHGMVYWQGQAIFEATEIQPFNDIELGESVFKFAPFCGDDFDWNTEE